MKITNKKGLPEPIVRVLTQDDYTRGPSNRSITQLIDSPRVRILRAEHEEDIEEDVSEMTWSVLGRAIHKLFEDETAFGAEERFFLDRQGWTISGAVDLQEEDSTMLTDYKSTSVWSVIYGKTEWHNQLNAYAWLARHAKGLRIDKLQIVTFLRDWSRRESETKKNYPAAPLMAIPIPVWPEAQQDAYMEGRIKAHQEAEFARITGDQLPPCSDEERWLKASTYAVKKLTNKRAIRVFDSMAEAEKYMEDKSLDDKHGIETRHGEPTRCVQDWCRVASICSQFQGEVWGNAGEG